MKNILGNYKFTNLKHPEKGIMSVILGVIALVSMVLTIFIPYLTRSQVLLRYALVDVIALIMAIIGEGLGVVSHYERDTYQLFPNVGMVLNGGTIIFAIYIIYAGLYGV